MRGGSFLRDRRASANPWTPICPRPGGGGGGLWEITAIAAIRERVATYSNVPGPLKGIGITFILCALMGIAFMSFLGIKL